MAIAAGYCRPCTCTRRQNARSHVTSTTPSPATDNAFGSEFQLCLNQAQQPGRQWRILGVALQLVVAASCAAVVTGFVARYRSGRLQDTSSLVC